MDRNDLLKVFPADFKWGSATAAYQIEGAVQEGGRGSSIWDTFSHTPGNTLNGDTGDVACDHYHRVTEDVQLMAELGLRNYRFSIAWPRIFPQGRGVTNPDGIAFYDRLVDTLLAQGISPMATLYHWDLPQTLQDKGGWGHRDTAFYFRDYAGTMAEKLGDRVKQWITHNEPWCTAVLGHYSGEHAPGLHDMALTRVVAHHLFLSHGLAVSALRTIDPKFQLGITLNLNTIYPAHPDSADDVLAQRYHDVYSNRWYLDPVLKGEYPKELDELFGPAPDAVRSEDLALCAPPIDFLGVNYYSSAVVAYDETAMLKGRNVTPQDNVTDMGWPIMPQGLTDLLTRVTRDYGPIPLFITENGAAYPDAVAADGSVKDPERVRYVSDHIVAVAQAITQGSPVKGYYLWSLMDNFEWGYGYSKRFGCVYVDYVSQKRIPKDSARWYSQWIQDFRAIHE